MLEYLRFSARGHVLAFGRAEAVTLEDALAVVGPFLDPLLAGDAVGEWDPMRQAWDGRS